MRVVVGMSRFQEAKDWMRGEGVVMTLGMVGRFLEEKRLKGIGQ